MRDPLIPPLLAVAAGVLFSRLLQFSMVDAAWPIAAFLALAAFGLRRANLLLAMVFVGAFFEAWHRPGAPPEIDFGARETMIVGGCVVEPTILSANREQFTLEIDRGARARVSLSLRDGQSPQRLDYGQHVEIDARLHRPHNYNNPGSFDYAAYLARQNIFWTATMSTGSEARVLPGRCGSRFMGAVFALRVAALDRIERLYGGDGYSTGMMEAILIGETSKLEKIWTENFRRTGTFHALVISGVHVTVLAGVLLFLLKVLMIPEIPALSATAAAAWLYALVSGFSPPVVRAAGGFTLYLAARFLFRRGRVLNLLAAIALVYLFCDPGAMFDASFQLSFLCVAAIGALAAPLLKATSSPLLRGTRGIASVEMDPHLEPRTAQFRVEMRLAAEAIGRTAGLTGSLGRSRPQRRDSRRDRLSYTWILETINLVARLGLYAFEMAVISTVVQIGLALPMAEYFHRVSFTGLTANLLIVPLLNCVVPIGFIAILTSWKWVAGVAAALLRWSAAVADWHARMEPSWRVADPPLWIALGFTAALLLMALSVGRRVWRWPALASVLGFFALLLWHPTRPDLHPGRLELTAIDVGQGDSLLVVFPDSKVMIVDGGGMLVYGRARKPNLDTGEDVVSPYLWSRGIRRVDVIAVTHAHEDHSGGIAALIENFRPREVWVGASPAARVLEAAARKKIPVIARRAGQEFEYGGAKIEVISPPADYAARQPGNNDSLAARIVFGRRSFLLTGDMEKPMEARTLADGREIQSDVLKVGHHGSKTSTIQPFLDTVSPSIALISAGYENSFGHPHRDVLARLTRRHVAVLRTDLDGLITVRTDGDRIWMDTMVWQGWSAWFQGEHGFNWALASEE